MVRECEHRYPNGHLNLPPRMGTIKDITKFDADFFGITDNEADAMESQMRILIELTYEALCDAGIDVNTLKGTNTGVFIGNTISQTSFANQFPSASYLNKIIAPQIAHIFDLKGPTKLYDLICASGLTALHEAVVSLRSNECDRAIVSGIQIIISPLYILDFLKLGALSPDGYSRSFDKSANGFVFSDGCSAIILQKSSEAKRIYATVVNTKTNADGFTESGLTHPSSEWQRNLFIDMYREVNVNPLDIGFVEAHGTGTPVGDPQEMTAIMQAYCNGRKTPLLVGSVKSNLGHSAAAAGIISMVKVILTFENQCIPANIHLNEANPNIEGIINGKLKVVTENTPFYGKLVSVNSFGIGGVNTSAILRSNSIESSKNNHIIVENIPRLIQICGRNEESVMHIFNWINSNPIKITRDFLSLLNDISKTSPFQLSSTLKGMNFRGFALIEDSKINRLTEINISEIREKKQIWFVFSGFNNKNHKTSLLMNVKIFAQSIKSSAKILKKFNIDLMSAINENKFMNCFIYKFLNSIAIQIAFVDLLRELNIKADGIIGHSIGELVCAYADGCLSAKETILIAYCIANTLNEAKLKPVMTAEIGIDLKEVHRRCTDGVYVINYNTENLVAVSGDIKIMHKFLNTLKEEMIQIYNIEDSIIPIHTPLIKSLKDELINDLRKIMPNNRERSSKWLSTSSLKSNSQLSAQYFANNISSPVLFYEALKNVPKNSVIIDMSSHNSLQTIIEDNSNINVYYIPLMEIPLSLKAVQSSLKEEYSFLKKRIL